MDNEIERQLEECYEHIKPYMDNEKESRELYDMCKNCESYCGKEHDYEDCRNKNCFKFYLAYKYLEWDNSYKYGEY